MNIRGTYFLIFLAILFSSNILVAQSAHYGPFAKATHYIQCLDILDTTSVNVHTGLRNIYRKDIVEFLQGDLDDLRTSYLVQDNPLFVKNSALNQPTKGYLKSSIFKTPANLISINRKSFDLYINPILNISFGNEKQRDGLRFTNLRGIELHGLIDEKVYFYSSILENQGNFHNYIEAKIRKHKTLPGYSFFKPFNSSIIDLNGHDYANAKAYLGVPISKHISLELGHGNHFIGHGYHSVLLEDYSNNYFYLKLNTRIWKFHYQNLFAELAPISTRAFSGDDLLPKKYMATHYLSFKPHKNIEIGLFESIIFSRVDNFEFQYLNPVILYRTVEYYLNSPDNVMIGLNGKWNLFNKISVYGQFLVDDIKFNELNSGLGWWGNKFAGQAGLFYPDAFGVENLDLRIEYNAVNPFTYSHRDTLGTFDNYSIANYSNYNQTLAHPLGANFQEALILIRYQPINKLELSTLISYAQQGRSGTIVNAGDDILYPNGTRSGDYGIHFLQGDLTNISSIRFQGSYSFYHNYYLDFTFLMRSEEGIISVETNYWGIGIRANFDGHRLDY